jgi:RHS repeat-associated protein
MLFAISIAFLFHPQQALASTPAYDQCIYALDSTAANALSISGAVTINAPSCGVVVDSSNSKAFSFSGAGSFIAKYFDVVGGYSTSGAVTLSPKPTTGSASQADPLTFLVPPVGSSCTYTNFKVTTGSSTLNPGTYCNGITISGATNVTFNPGTYILMGGGLKVSGASVLKGSGVTFFLTKGLGYNYGPLAVSGAVVATLSAPTSGPYYGILFYQDKSIGTGQAANTVTGSSSSSLSGVLYFPTTALTLSGAASAKDCLIVVADTISLTGAAALGNSCSGASPLQPPAPVAVSVTPTTATLYGGQTQQFTATVTNTSNTAVTWKISPATGAGTISSTGLYTALATISAQQTVTVTATSQASTSASGSATVILMPKSTPAITWATPAAITYGAALNATQLDATASVPGIFAYTPAAGTVMAAGSQTLSVTFTPTNTTSYNTTTISVPLMVNKAVLTVTATNASRVYGAANPSFTDTITGFVNGDTASVVSGTPSLTTTATATSTPGSYPITASAGTLSAANYSFSFVAGTLTVNKATQSINFPAPASPVIYGVSPITLSATASSGLGVTFSVVSGPGTISGSTLTITGAGTVVVAVNQAGNANYAAAAQVTQSVTVNKATPAITWATPAAITYDTALSGIQLNASSTVAGTFVYTPAAGTVLTAGSQTLSVTLMPTDSTDYTTATNTVQLTVNQATQTINFPAPASPVTYGVAPITLTATASSGLPVTFSVLSGPGSIAGSTLTITGSGTVVVAANQAGNSNYAAAAQVTQSITVTSAQCGSSGYSYRRVLTILHTQVPNTDQTDYPMLVSGVYPFLATVANGGRVQNANGYDIVFTSDAAGQNPLDFEIDSYNGTNGTAAFWVRIPMLSHTVDTTIYMWYGNPNINGSQENIAGVWRNNYLSVYHLGNGTSIGTADSGSAGYTLAQSGSVSSVAGVIGGGAAFNGDAGSYLYHDSVTAYPSGSTGQETLEVWEQFPTNGGGEVFGYGANWPTGSRIALASSSTGPMMEFENIAISDSVPINNAWHHLVGTYAGGGVTSSTSQLYLDGVPLPGNDNSEGNVNISTAELKIGGIPTVTFCCGLTGAVDEVRISSVVRSEDWISTEYNNESSPSTFYQLSDENEAAVTPTSVILYNSQTQQFSANSCLGSLAWALSPAGVGTLTTSGFYTAPSSIAAQQTVTVTATDQANPASPASATITLDPPIAVSMTPASATLYSGQSQQFTATVLYTGNTAVTWSVSPAGAGSITASGLFTATSSLAAGQSVTITATSQADPTKSAVATVSLSPLPCPNTGYSFERRIAINHAMVPNTDQANFPVLIAGTYPYLATAANGGQIQNTNGYDIMFSSDAAGHNKLDYEIDSYNGTTGAVAYWVRVPVVSHTNDTALYMWYGNPYIGTSQENRAGVWSNAYAGVWHFGTPESGIAADSTVNGNNGINHGVLPKTGIFGSAGWFDGTGNTFLDIPSSTSYKPTSTLTLEAWVNMADGYTTNYPDIFSLDFSGNGNGPQTYGLEESSVWESPLFTVDVNGTREGISANPRLQGGRWGHVVGTYDGQQMTLYENGVVISMTPAPGVINYGSSKDLDIGTFSPYAAPSGWSYAGLMDEARISTVARSADWIATQYSNQSSPSTFYSVGSVISSAVNLQPSAVNLYALQSQQFEVVSSCGAADAIWSMPAGSPGTLTSGGIYIAPESITSHSTVTITATTLGISSTATTATVTLMPPVSVSVTPPSTVLTNSQTQQLTANVANTSQTAVNWAISPASAGSIGATGLYSAPGNITAPQTVTITATSQWYPTELASATITLTPSAVTPIPPPPTQCGASGYSSQSTIVINHTKVQNTDQSDFPFLFNTTDPSLATITNGGQVTSSSGYDIIFSTDPNGLTKLDHELEGYNPLTGQVTAWVRIPTLSHTTDTVLYVFYGNPNITTSQQNPVGVWGTNYQAVYHLSNLGTGVAADSSTYGNNATLTSVVPAPGGIDGTASFNGVSSYVQAPTTVFPSYPLGTYANVGIPTSSQTTSTPFAASFGVWFNTASAGGILGQAGQMCAGFFMACYDYQPVVPGDYDPYAWNNMLYVDTNGTLIANGGGIVTSTAYNDSKWHFAVMTYANDGTDTLYVDGKSVGSQQLQFPGGYSPYYEYFIGTTYTFLTQDGNWNWLYFNGDIDEVSITNNAQTADWIGTEYNNQSSPSTFSKFSPPGTVLVVPSPVSLYAAQSQQFAAAGTCSSGVNWTLQQGAPGTLSPTGLYTAPTSFTTQQSVTVTASSQANGTAIGSAAVTLLPPPPPISLVAAAQPPYVIGSTLTFVASLKDQTGTPEPGVAVVFAVSGANSSFGRATSDTNGNAAYTYAGANIGNDTIQATAVVNGVLLTSNSVSAAWTISTGPNPAASITLAGEPALGLGGLIGAFTDNTGAVIEPMAIGASAKSFVVPAGATQLQLGINDSYLADNGGAGFTVAVNGVPVSVLATTVPWNWVTGGLNNNYQFGIGTAFNPSGDGTSPVVVKGLTQGQSVSVLYQSGTVSTNFPTKLPVNADGDRTNITGGTLFQGAYYPTLYTTASSYPVGQPITFNALVTDSSGTPLSNIPVTLYVTGANPGQFQAATDSTGTAAFLYSGLYPGTDSLQAQAFPSGQTSLSSSQASVTWITYPTPPPIGSLSLNWFAKANDLETYTAMATDASGNPVANADVGFYVSGVDNLQSNAMTDITGHTSYGYWHEDSGKFTIAAVDSVGRNVTFSTPIVETWTMPTTNAPCGNCNAINISISAQSAITMPNPLQLNGTVTDSVGILPTVAWSKISGPGIVTFANPQQATTSATFSQAGIYVLQLYATDTGVSASDQIAVTVNPVPLPAETPDWGGSPQYGATITGVVPIILPPGISLQGGTLTYFPVNNIDNITILNENTVSSSSPVIGTLDTTTLVNGSYWIELQATDIKGNPQNDLVQVTVAGNYKPGRVTASVTDLIVPATGLAINIQRQYDSLNAGTSGDFGYGWNLSINTNLTTDTSNNVTFTIGGQRKTFYFTPGIIPCSQNIFAGAGCFQIFDETWAGYTAEPGLAGTLTPQLDETNCPFGLMARDGSIWLCSTGSLYSPLGYTYTDASGSQYSINANGALQSITDRSGNGLTVTPNGITSTTGLSVPFVRDVSNRITQITDPQGNIYSYAYDGNGNLASVTYPPTTQTSALCPNTTQPNTSTYTYDSNHLYTGGTDALCHILPSTAYYPSGTLDASGNSLTGRLQSVSDALGETTGYAYNLATNTTTITYPPDANGNTGTAVMSYDSYGMLLTSTDPLGLTTTNVYDANHNLISVTDPLGHTNSYTYDSNGNKTSSTYPQVTPSGNTTSHTAYNQYSEPTSTTDELGNVRTFNYDANYNPQSVTDTINAAPATLASFIFNPNGTLQAGAIGYDITAAPAMASQFTYDANGNMTARIDALGRTTFYTYNPLGQKTAMVTPTPASLTGSAASATTYTHDAFGNLLQTAAPLGRTTASTYDDNGNKTTDTDARGNVTTYQYDALNRLTITTYPTNPVTTSTKSYDFRNNLIDETDQAGHITHHVYDLSGRQTSITKGYGTPQASATSFTYYDDGRKHTETDALNHTTTYLYDAAGRLTSIAGPKGNFTYAYDAAGNRISSADGNGNTTAFQYDARRRMTKTRNPDGTSVVNSYDGPGNLASVTDAAGAVVQYAYDPANQLHSVVQLNHPNPSNNTNTYGYDPLGNLTALTDENLHATQNVFDLLNQPVSKTLPDQTLTETRQYDAAGNLVSLTHFNGMTTTYTYDALNRRLTQATPGEPTISFAYTATGKYATSTAGDGTVNYSYDPLDRLIAKMTPEGTLNYTFDAAGHVASIVSSNPNGASVSLTWDELDRLSTVVDNRLPTGSNTTTYTYDPASNVATVTAPNGLTSTFIYDSLNRLTSLTTPISSYTYTLGATGNRTGAIEGNGRTLTWNYDGIYRLTNETISNDPANNGSASYNLDPVGNRLSAVSSLTSIASGSFSYNPDDEISSETYDANGNVLSAGGVVYTYDSENHMTSATGNGKVVTMVYDAFGNRVAKTVNGVTTKYLVEDDVNPTGLPQVLEETINGVVQRSYTYGLQRISESQFIGNTWTTSFYGYDGSGSVRQLTNSTGIVTDEYEYDAFGNSFTKSGTTPNNYLYRGEQFDSDLGLYYLRARYYNPQTGRFLSRDPEDGYIDEPATLHKYLYAGGDPVNLIDPRGQGALWDFLIINAVIFQITIPRAVNTYGPAICDAVKFFIPAGNVAGVFYHNNLLTVINTLLRAVSDFCRSALL